MLLMWSPFLLPVFLYAQKGGTSEGTKSNAIDFLFFRKSWAQAEGSTPTLTF